MDKDDRTAYTFMICSSSAIMGALITNLPTETWQKVGLFVLAIIFIVVAENKWGK